jgi:hypothetical protein
MTRFVAAADDAFFMLPVRTLVAVPMSETTPLNAFELEAEYTLVDSGLTGVLVGDADGGCDAELDTAVLPAVVFDNASVDDISNESRFKLSHSQIHTRKDSPDIKIDSPRCRPSSSQSNGSRSYQHVKTAELPSDTSSIRIIQLHLQGLRTVIRDPLVGVPSCDLSCRILVQRDLCARALDVRDNLVVGQ